MNKREERVINAFVNCVRAGEFTYDYAVTLIENNEKYGYLSEAAKESFYVQFETAEAEEPAEEVTEEIPEEETTE